MELKLIGTVVLIVLVTMYLRDKLGWYCVDRWTLATTVNCEQCRREIEHLKQHDTDDSTKLVSVGNPLFNAREAAKQIVLLEQHLEQPELRCMDCIRKHFLTIEGLLEEAIGLDRAGRYQSLFQNKPERVRAIIAEFNNRKDYLRAAQKMRDIRKELVNASFDMVK